MSILKIGIATAMILTVTSINAATVSQMKACKIAVLEQSKFHDLPMAAVSVYPGKKKNHAHFSVRWDGLKAEGNCKVSGNSYVEKVKIKNFHDGRSGNSGSGYNSQGLDGFYWDRHIGKWRDPNGRVCHTCTPENGFPDHSQQYYGGSHSNNEYERMMKRELLNKLSDDDIRTLNSLGN
jgi:hypothetical protein